MIRSAPRIPSRCSGAPEMPSVRYSLGLTVTPLLPTCRVLGSHPASVTGREADSSAPNAWASSSASSMFSALPMPRPTDTSLGCVVMSTSPPARFINLPNLIVTSSSPTGEAICSLDVLPLPASPGNDPAIGFGIELDQRRIVHVQRRIAAQTFVQRFHAAAHYSCDRLAACFRRQRSRLAGHLVRDIGQPAIQMFGDHQNVVSHIRPIPALQADHECAAPPTSHRRPASWRARRPAACTFSGLPLLRSRLPHQPPVRRSALLSPSGEPC